MDNQTRVVRYADEEDVKALCKEIAALDKRLQETEQELAALKRKVENSNKPYGAWGGFPPNEKYWLDCRAGLHGVGNIVFETFNKETNDSK